MAFERDRGFLFDTEVDRTAGVLLFHIYFKLYFVVWKEIELT